MRARALLAVSITLALGYLALAETAVLVARQRAARLELGRVARLRLSPAFERKLASLRDDVFIIYYVTARERMPSHMRRVEREVTDLLEAMREAARGRLQFHIVDPTAAADLQRFAARRAVAPLRLRHVARDAYSEQEVWSTITIAYGPRKPAMIEGVGPEHLPRLQALILGHLNQLEIPRAPVFALSAPAGFARLEAFLKEKGRVVKCALAAGARIPEDADVLFWMDPGQADAALIAELRRFLASGRSVVVAGGLYAASLGGAADAPALRLAASGYDADALLGAFGLRPVPGLLLDARSAELELPSGGAPAPFRVACLAPDQDFHSLAREPLGVLLFFVPTPFALEAERLAEEGWTADVLTTSSDRSSLLQVGAGELPLSALAAAAGEGVPKQALLVRLCHADPWQGSLVAAAASSLFHDETFDIDTLAHKRLTGVLVDTLASGDRLVLGRSGVHRPAPLPALSRAARTAWQAFAVLLFPALLAAVAVARRLSRQGARVSAPRGARAARGRCGSLFLRVAAGLLGVLLVARGAAAPGWRVDLSGAKTNSLCPASIEIARRAGARAEVDVELLLAPERLTPDTIEGAILGAAPAVGVAKPGLRSVGVFDACGPEGCEPARVTSKNDEVTTVRTVWSALRFESAGRVEALPLPDAAAFEDLEFRIAFALWRLATGRRPHVAFASDAPRLSAGEAHHYFQTRGLIPPAGKDAYSLAREILRRAGFRVTHVNPRAPEMPPDVDLLVWLQPRRDVKLMMEAFVEHLYRGGRALLAAQHFNIQSRQHLGADLEFAYWPQPQSPDVEEFYFPDLGLQLVREVLFDAVSMPIDLESQVDRSARREFAFMHIAKPFLIRALAADFSRDSLITRNLGDQAFLCGSYFRLDETKLAAEGLKAGTLITTSPRSWSFDWQGGWLPRGCLSFPPSTDDGAPVPLLGRAPLALLVEGTFPWPERAFVHPPVRLGGDGVPVKDPVPPYPRPEPAAEAAPGRLFFLGCSEMFKDERLLALRPEFRADHLLVNAAAALALEPALAEIGARRAAARGFEPPGAHARARWQLAAILTIVALLLLIGAARRLALLRAAGA
ncbi:MAG: Gldg family protein [Planctomycetes bacterium]|nr:Gldg family protein [Planctomycetota bacterium]